MENKRIWHLMLLSFFVPIIGGIIVYLLKKNEDKNLANICLTGSIINPLLIGFILGLFITSWIIYAVIIFIGLIFNWVIIKNIFPDNEYRYFFSVFWFSLLGAIYSYYYAYKENENLKNNVGWFCFFQIILSIIGRILLLFILMLFLF